MPFQPESLSEYLNWLKDVREPWLKAQLENMTGKNVNGQDSSASAVGAKRRKPTKTNKVTQQQQTINDAEEEMSPPPPPPSPPPPTTATAETVEEKPPHQLPNALPPGMPIPPITSTSVVEPSNTDHMYTCPLCHENQATQKDFTTHIRGHNEVKPHNDPNDPTGQAKVYYCCLCGKMLSSFSSLDRHMLVHSGERPFSCDLCGQTFTTNGNMHRHKRTHGNRDSHLNPDGTSPPGRKAGRKRKSDGDESKGRGRASKKAKEEAEATPATSEDQQQQQHQCPVCKETFSSEINLDHHMYEAHPGRQEIVCDQCNFPCPNSNYLKLHKTMFHFTANSSSTSTSTATTSTTLTPSSFELTTQSQQFPQLAKAILNEERNGKPQSAFMTNTTMASVRQPPPMVLPPSAITAAAEAAAAAAASLSSPTRHIRALPNNNNGQLYQSNGGDNSEGEDADDDRNGSDLADVQSILSITRSRNNDHQSDTSSVVDNSSSGQDDPLIRDMKLKGEFPCRLCTAVYPNLRALKGHNKEHLGKPPYVCNVGACTYSSNDKSTLTRHMRTHTGEKPFECKLCNYGFTTKANCERHLKNKHSKTSREAIRTAIIVHESDDHDAIVARQQQLQESEENSSNAEEQQQQPQPERRQSLSTQNQYRCKVCKQTFPSTGKVIAHAVKDHPAYSNDVDHIFEEVKRPMLMDDAPSMVPRPMPFPLMGPLRPSMSSQQLLNRKQQSESNDSSSEAPLDLSRPSGPDSSTDDKDNSPPTPAAATAVNYANLPPLKLQGKIRMVSPEALLRDANNSTAQAAAAAAAAAGILPHSFPYIFAAGANPVAGAPGAAPGIRPSAFPLLFPFVPTNAAAAAAAAAMGFLPNLEAFPPEMREHFQAQIKQRLQLPGGGASMPLLHPPASAVSANGSTVELATAYMQSQQQQQELLRKQTELKEQKEAAEALQHLSKVQTLTSAKAPSLQNGGSSSGSDVLNDAAKGGNNSDSDSNYKMVIKNGVLMKKQKQRRYRTERPYGCNFCNARFTLRSNMERHIKQQHPEHWSQKPRGSRRNHTATVPILAPQFRDGEEGEQGDGEEEDSTNNKNEQENEGEEELEEALEASENGEDGSLIIDEPGASSNNGNSSQDEGTLDLASVPKLLNSAASQSFKSYFDHEDEEDEEEDKDADISSSEGDNNSTSSPVERKKSAYSAAPHKISCPYCERKFPWTSSLKRHILTHTGHKPYKCPECPLWFTTKSNCDRHLVRKHGNNNSEQSYTMRNVPERPYKCQMCPSSTFSSQSNLRKHHFSKHLNVEYPGLGELDDDEDEDEEDDTVEEDDLLSPYRCHVCNKGYPEKEDALEHLKSDHTEDFTTASEHKPDSAAAVEPAEQEQEPEPNDNEADNDNNESTAVEVNGHRKIYCAFCPGHYASMGDLRKHMRLQHGVQYTCEVCQKAFTRKNTMLGHRKKHDSVVSSADEESEADANSSSSQPVVAQPKQQKAEMTKKRANLMDKINKLSSAAVGQPKDSMTIDNIFSVPQPTTTTTTTSNPELAASTSALSGK